MADFMAYPKVSIILPDIPENEDLIDMMYAILVALFDFY